MLTFNINGNGFHGGNVPAVEAALVGYYVKSIPYRPDPDAIKALLPRRWHVAYERTCRTLWFDENGKHTHVDLWSSKGKLLTTIYAHVKEN